MDLRDLRYFETIAELGHVGRAAARLHRTQPALTSALRRLEEASGAPLVERAGRGIRLTAAGHVLLQWAQRVRIDVDDARREISEIKRGLSGEVRVGVIPTAAAFLLPPAVRRLLAEAPDATVRTTVALVDALAPMLRAGEIDLMIATETSQEPGIETRPLTSDAIVVAARAGHEVLRGPVSMRDLCRHTWVLQPPGAPTRDWLDHTFDRYHLPRPRVQVEASTLLMLPTLIAETGLLSFISRRHLDEAGVHGDLREVRLRATTMRRSIVVSHRSHGYLPPITRRFAEILRDADAPAGARRGRTPRR